MFPLLGASPVSCDFRLPGFARHRLAQSREAKGERCARQHPDDNNAQHERRDDGKLSHR